MGSKPVIDAATIDRVIAICDTLPEGKQHCYSDAAKAALAEAGITLSYDDIAPVGREQRRGSFLASVETTDTTPAIKAFLRTVPEHDDHFESKVTIVDQRGLGRLAANRKQSGAPIYSPKPGCNARLRLRMAVRYSFHQADVADYVMYAVPVEIFEGADVTACRANLHHFADCLRTHTGTAGSGSTWEASLEQNEHGYFALLRQRISLPD